MCCAEPYSRLALSNTFDKRKASQLQPDSLTPARDAVPHAKRPRASGPMPATLSHAPTSASLLEEENLIAATAMQMTAQTRADPKAQPALSMSVLASQTSTPSTSMRDTEAEYHASSGVAQDSSVLCDTVGAVFVDAAGIMHHECMQHCAMRTSRQPRSACYTLTSECCCYMLTCCTALQHQRNLFVCANGDSVAM